MFCGDCGAQNPDTNQFCRNCGRPLRRPTATPPAAPLPVPPAAPQQEYYPPPVAYPPAATVPAGAPVTVKSPLKKGMLVLGIFGMGAGIASWFVYPYICGIAAVLLGGIAFYRAGNRKGIVAVIAILAILIGLSSMVVDNFYFVLFPPPEIEFELLSVLI